MIKGVLNSAAYMLLLLTLTSTTCSKYKQLQKEPPVKIGQAYFQKWISGVQGGGSGIDLFIPVEETKIQFDSVYFKGKVAKLEEGDVYKNLLLGRFYTTFNSKRDLVMSNDPEEEYGNELPELPKRMPFNIDDDECLISYIKGDRKYYFKVGNIIEKQSTGNQSAPPPNNNK